MMARANPMRSHTFLASGVVVLPKRIQQMAPGCDFWNTPWCNATHCSIVAKSVLRHKMANGKTIAAAVGTFLQYLQDLPKMHLDIQDYWQIKV